MEIGNMKNIVVLKNLPSNIVDEAIVILKANKNARKLEYIESSAKQGIKEKNNAGKDYIIKEAESVISSYISKFEKSKERLNMPKTISKKYKILKLYSITVTTILAFVILKIFI